MAKIKGYEVKAIKTMQDVYGHVGFSANLYYKNRKIGAVSDDGLGGGTQIRIEDKESRNKFEEVARSYIGRDVFSDEIFVSELVKIKDIQQHYKKAKKDGYEYVVELKDDPFKKGPKKVPQIYYIVEESKEDIEGMGYDIVTYYGEDYFNIK